MKVEVRFRGVDPSDAVRRHAARRIHFHLSRFAPEIRAVVVRLEDPNGPRGGVDKRCQVMVRGPRIGAAMLADLSADAYAAIDLAVGRIGRVVARSLARGRARRGAAARVVGRGAVGDGDAAAAGALTDRRHGGHEGSP